MAYEPSSGGEEVLPGRYPYIENGTIAGFLNSRVRDRGACLQVIDFLEDGSQINHRTFWPKVTNRPPPYSCPLAPRSMRILIWDARRVFNSKADHMGSLLKRTPDSPHDTVECTQCFPPGCRTPRRPPCRQRPESLSTSGASSPKSSPQSWDAESDDSSDGADGNFAAPQLEYESRSVWRRYRGAAGLDGHKLFAMWDLKADETRIPLGVNVAYTTRAREELSCPDVGMHAKAADERHTLSLNGRLIAFYTLPALVKTVKRNDGCIDIHLRSFSGSPMGLKLAHLLGSSSSAMRLYAGDIDLGRRLFTFDLLRVLIECWTDFLDELRQRSMWTTKRLDGLEDIEEKLPDLGDREHITDFAKAVRDITQLARICCESIQMHADFTTDQSVCFADLQLRIRSDCEVLQNCMRDVEDNIDNLVSKAEKLNLRRQEESLKRLTLVASIFLPLTFACSLLSMGNRVKDIGGVWWDWMAIVLITALTVMIGYRTTRFYHNVQIRLRYGIRYLKSVYRDTKVVASRRTSGSTRQKPRLIPSVARLTMTIGFYLFMLGLIVSLLLGMFLDIGTGAETFGYVAAGSVSLVVAVVMVWRLVQLLELILYHISKRYRHWKTGRTLSISPQSSHVSDQESQSEHQTPPRSAVLHMWWLRWAQIGRGICSMLAFALVFCVRQLFVFFLGTAFVDVYAQVTVAAMKLRQQPHENGSTPGIFAQQVQRQSTHHKRKLYKRQLQARFREWRTKAYPAQSEHHSGSVQGSEPDAMSNRTNRVDDSVHSEPTRDGGRSASQESVASKVGQVQEEPKPVQD